VDLVLLGDPEGFSEDLFRSLGEGGALRPSRQALVEEMGKLVGVLVPGDAARNETTARWVEPFPLRWAPPLVSLTEVAFPGFPVLLSRPRGPAGLPWAEQGWRYRDADDVIAEVETLVAETGCSDVRLTGEGASRHPELLPILEILNQRLHPHEVGVRLETVDPSVLTPPLARELRKNRFQTLVFTPQAVSERLRAARGRPLTSTAMVEAARTAALGGWAQLRFRVYVGVPGETEEDRREWERTMVEIAAVRSRRGFTSRFQLEVVPFVPSPGAGGVEAPALSPREMEAVAGGWRAALKRHRIRVVDGDFVRASLEGILLGGAAAAGTALRNVHAQGVRRAGKGDAFEEGRWKAALEEAGLFGSDASRSAPPPQWGSTLVPAPASALGSPGFGTPAWTGGRRPRRAGRGRDTRTAERYRLRYSKDDAMRFFSHLDVTRSFERACRRSQLPVAMSQGKDRRPRFSFGPPLPLGMTGAAEVFDVTFSQEVPEGFVRSLNEMLPEGLTVVAAAPIRSEGDSLSSAIQLAEYEVSFPDPLIQAMEGISFDELKSRLEESAERAMATDTIMVTRMKGKKPQTFNARPSLIRTEVVRDDGGRPALNLRLSLGQPESVRPEILTTALLTWTPIEERLLRVHRSGLYIPGRVKDLDPLEVVGSGFAWWRQPVRGGTVL